MFTKNSYRGIDPELVKMVRMAAKKAVRKGGLPLDELPDIEQELMIAMLSGMKQHDPGKSSRKTFLTMLLNVFYSQNAILMDVQECQILKLQKLNQKFLM